MAPDDEKPTVDDVEVPTDGDAPAGGRTGDSGSTGTSS